MIRLLIIIPYPDLNEKISRILELGRYRNAFNATVQLIAIEKLEQVDPTGYDMVIARGYTARTMLHTPGVPVLPFPTTSYDILRAIAECRRLHPDAKKICCIGPYEDFHALSTITDIIDIPIEVITNDHWDGLDQCIDLAVSHGCDAFIGGYSLRLAARAKGFPAVSITTGDEAICNVLDEAIRVVEMANMRHANKPRKHRAKYHFEDFSFESDIMNSVVEKSRFYAATSSNMILLGENGTEKEFFAHCIHNASLRRNGPFISINCGAFSEYLLEQKLFGYTSNIFAETAEEENTGLIRLAQGGTLFLDEVSELPVSIQRKLLYVLQQYETRQKTSRRSAPSDVRIICASSCNLKKMAMEGRFFQDLLYYLDVLRIVLPPFRQRGREILHYFQEFLDPHLYGKKNVSYTLTPEAENLLLAHPFYGNLYELRSVTERISVLHTTTEPITVPELSQALFPDDMERIGMSASCSEASIPLPEYPDSEYQRIQQALLKHGGNQTKAARELGMDRSTLWRKLKKYQK